MSSSSIEYLYQELIRLSELAELLSESHTHVELPEPSFVSSHVEGFLAGLPAIPTYIKESQDVLRYEQGLRLACQWYLARTPRYVAALNGRPCKGSEKAFAEDVMPFMCDVLGITPDVFVQRGYTVMPLSDLPIPCKDTVS
jgi:hypothetical protein